jgi:UDP-N-acetylglucosamine 4,6-dehydratase/5-epimerase
MKKILVIGGTGSLGNMIASKFEGKYQLYVYSRGEDAQWRMKSMYPNITFIIGDIADKHRLQMTLDRIKPNHIIIAAALKHIDVCEFNTGESIKTNITGIQNVADVISDMNHEQLDSVVFVSTDKACSPSNVYGMCKALGERIIIEKSMHVKKCRFTVVRYGNVLNSRGSILPKFHDIGRNPDKKAFCITSDKMTRFFMSLDHSVDLIEYAMIFGKSGCTYVPKLSSYRIYDVALVFSELYGKPIECIGIRPGEKIHEELINEIECKRTNISGEYYEITPVVENQNINEEECVISNYTSDQNLCTDKEKIKELILSVSY